MSKRTIASLSRAAARLSCYVHQSKNQSRAFASSTNNTPPPFSILFFGTDSFSLPTLDLLASNPTLASHIAVMCPQDAPSGRGMKLQPCAVKQFALQRSLPVRAACVLVLCEGVCNGVCKGVCKGVCEDVCKGVRAR